MNKKINILKSPFYDNFKCTANRCRITCCKGWDVSIDNDTYRKWANEKSELEYALNNIKSKKCKDKTEYFINKETKEKCPLLDINGLCEVVKKNGEDYLSTTCHTFPRIENVFENRKELSLSCSCPEVVEIIGNINEVSEEYFHIGEGLKEEDLELKIRNNLIKLVQNKEYTLEYKLILAFQMLIDILENKNYEKEILERYKDKEYIKEALKSYKEIDLNIDESLEEVNYLFLDIIENYKEVSGLEVYLKEISDFAQELKYEDVLEKWQEYKAKFSLFGRLIENCITFKIFSSCVSEDIEDFIISYEMIVLEFILVRYAMFLKYCMNSNGEINIQDIKDYIVVFSRIIENNSEAVIEFIEDGFGSSILEVGYLSFISLF